MKYTQHLSLAASIISDMRLDRPRIASLWALSRENKHASGEMTHDEMRALAGTYYLSSRYVKSFFTTAIGFLRIISFKVPIQTTTNTIQFCSFVTKVASLQILTIHPRMLSQTLISRHFSIRSTSPVYNLSSKTHRRS